MAQREHCCSDMARAVTFPCDTCADEFDCPDSLVIYSERYREYGLIIHDGGESWLVIVHCPWCGMRLPESERSPVSGRGIDPTS